MKTLLKVAGVAILVVVVTGVSLFLFSEPAGKEHVHRAPPKPQDEVFAGLDRRADETTEDVQAAWDDYRTARDDYNDKGLELKLARRLSETALEHAGASDLADITLELHDDGHEKIAQPMLEPAWQRMRDQEKVFPARYYGDIIPKDIPKPDPRFVRIVELLDWRAYERPRELDDAEMYEVEGAAEFREYYGFEVDGFYHSVYLYPPEIADRLEELAEVALAGLEELRDRNDKDGYALNARAAWIRFKHAHDSVAKIDRLKGQRSFSPKALGREDEPFGEIWTYTYWKPFVVYIEKPFDANIDETFKNEVAALLRQLAEWFRVNYVEAFDLERRRPQYDAQTAEKEGWPIEIILFGQRRTYDQYVKDVTGESREGTDGFYSPLEGRVISYLEPWQGRDEDLFYRSALVKDVFLMLSDYYAADPQFREDELMQRPRYSTLLIQEGLAETVAGITREGEGADTEYEFMQVNSVRLRSFTHIRGQLGDRLLFRLRDVVGCRTYGQVAQVAYKRATEMENLNPEAVSQSARGMYVPAAWAAVYFFENYKENDEFIYRDVWRKFVELDYTGQLKLKSYSDDTAIKKFKELFGIETDEDWDAIDQKWLDFTLSLEP